MNDKQSKLKELEDELIKSYDNFKSDNNKQTSTLLFMNLKAMIAATLVSNKYHINKDKSEVEHMTYECAVYLFEKILNGTFVPMSKSKNALKDGQTDRFPWYRYLTFSIRRFVNVNSESLFSTDMFIDLDSYSHLAYDEKEYGSFFKLEEMFSDEKQSKINVEKHINAKLMSKKIFEALRLFYDKDEIDRLYPIASEYIVNNKIRYAEEDIRNFCYTLICLAKRIANNHNSVSINEAAVIRNLKLDNVVNSAIKSSIFIAAIMKNEHIFPKELLLALDIESIYRLCTIKGGETIHVPSLSDLETLIGSTVIAARKLTDGTTVSKRKVRDEYGFCFKKNFNIDDLVNSLLFSISNFNNNSTTPLLNTLLSSVKAIEKQSDFINKNSDKMGNNEVVECFVELNNSLSMLTSSFMCLNGIIKNNMNASLEHSNNIEETINNE